MLIFVYLKCWYAWGIFCNPWGYFPGIFGNLYLHSVPWPRAPPPAAVGLRNSVAGTPQETPQRGPGGHFGNSGAAPGDVEQDPEFCEFPAPRDRPWEAPGSGRGWNGDSGSCKNNPVRENPGERPEIWDLGRSLGISWGEERVFWKILGFGLGLQ